MEAKSPQAAENDPGGEQPTASEASRCHMNPHRWRENGTVARQNITTVTNMTSIWLPRLIVLRAEFCRDAGLHVAMRRSKHLETRRAKAPAV
jgi:hypothetical protein